MKLYRESSSLERVAFLLLIVGTLAPLVPYALSGSF